MKTLVVTFCICLFLGLLGFGQTQISGVINSYSKVSQVNLNTQSAVLNNATEFNSGDLVMIIQMQGAQIDESQSNSFGTISSMNGAGSYELHRICRKVGNEVFFQNQIQIAIHDSGNVQVVKIPEYSSGADLIDSITTIPWNNGIGGVIAMRVKGTLHLNGHSIVADGLGFQGGEALPSGGGCLPISLNIAYTDKNSADDRGMKGEGIAKYIPGKECSRGPQANGGGGGNNHNGGGSGGANFGAGGSGGQRVKASPLACGSVAGLNSKTLITGYSNGKMFLGGGGGAGHGNTAGSDGEWGENGGGIVFIEADTIIGSNSFIQAKGLSTTLNTENEGGGGGGAGGSVIVSTSHLSGNLTIDLSGGKGADVDNIGTGNCSGPGGGGGGGFFGISLSALPVGLNLVNTGGKSGEIASSAQPGCSVGNTNGASDGSSGGHLTSYTINDRSANLNPVSAQITACNKYPSPSGKYLWTQSGQYIDTALNAGGCDSILDIQLTIVPVDTSVVQEQNTLISTASGVTYQWIDCATKQEIPDAIQQQFSPTYSGSFAVVVGTGSCTDTSFCQTITGVSVESSANSTQFLVYPNPSTGQFSVQFENSDTKTIKLIDMNGKLLRMEKSSEDQVSFHNIPSGSYTLEVIGKKHIKRQIVLVQ